MSKPDVLVMAAAGDKAMVQLDEHYQLYRSDQASDPDTFLSQYGERCQAIVTNGHTDLTEAHLNMLPNVGIVACSSAGYETIDTLALAKRNIPLTNSSAALIDDVADLALLLTLAARRELIPAHDYVKSGEWARAGMYPLLSSIRGKKAGIVGLGNIGQAIAKRLEPLGLDIAYTARGVKNVPYRFHPDSLSLAAWADILLVVLPGGAATEGLINEAVLSAIGSHGTLINVGRGTVLDETALITCLKDGRLASAGLDVYWNEPQPNAELVALPNVVLYPHHASGTVETRDAMSQLVVDNLAAHFAGEALLTPVSL